MIALTEIPSHVVLVRCNARCARAVFAFAFLALAPAFAHAQTASDPVASIAKTLHQRTDPPAPEDFVRRSRPKSELGYVPVNGPRPQPRGKALKRDQIMAEEAELQAARARQDRIAGRRPSGGGARSAAGDPYVPKTKKLPPKCLLTCEIK